MDNFEAERETRVSSPAYNIVNESLSASFKHSREDNLVFLLVSALVQETQCCYQNWKLWEFELFARLK